MFGVHTSSTLAISTPITMYFQPSGPRFKGPIHNTLLPNFPEDITKMVSFWHVLSHCLREMAYSTICFVRAFLTGHCHITACWNDGCFPAGFSAFACCDLSPVLLIGCRSCGSAAWAWSWPPALLAQERVAGRVATSLVLWLNISINHNCAPQAHHLEVFLPLVFLVAVKRFYVWIQPLLWAEVPPHPEHDVSCPPCLSA